MVNDAQDDLLSPTAQLRMLDLHENHFEQTSLWNSPPNSDLSFSMMLETKSKHRSHSKRRMGYGLTTLSTLKENAEEGLEAKNLTRKNSRYQTIPYDYDGDDLTSDLKEQQAQERDEDNEWSHSDVSVPGDDVYRFVQPRRLSSWVQDDAVYACFKCHTQFTLLIRKHHCRACGRIFCSACSNQRLVIPIDYESTPVSYALQQNSYSSAIASNATEVIGHLSYYVWSYNSPAQPTSEEYAEFSGASSSSSLSFREGSMDEVQRKAELDREKFLKSMADIEERGIVTKFTPSAVPTHKLKQLQQAPKGSVLQRVCDDCASALQQRRQHYNMVRIFELCDLDIKTLRVLGQVCRKWHRASIMCLSTFRQIQYYLPSHPLSLREKNSLIRNRKFLAGHSKWLLQLVKAVDFSQEVSDDATAEDILGIIQAPRRYNCMMTMCSRLCRPELETVDALEILSNQAIQNVRLRNLCVNALQRKASSEDWLSFLPIVLHSLSIETAASTLGDAIVSHTLNDVRFCSDLYWGLSVLAEDQRCRRKFDGFRQRLLLRLAEFSDIPEQLLLGQEFIDILWKLPHRVDRQVIVNCLQTELAKSKVFKDQPLRLPLEPNLTFTGIDYCTVKVMRSAEAPLILTCTDIQQVPSTEENVKSPRQKYRLMYKRDDLRKDSAVQNIIRVMYWILKQETQQFNSSLVTYRVTPTSSYDGLIEIVENAHTLYSIIREHGNIMHFLHHYNGHRTLSDISTSFRESLAAYTVITFLLGVGDRHAENVMLTNDGKLFHIDYGFILGKDPKPLQPPMRLDSYMMEALGGPLQVEAFKAQCVIAFNCLRRHVSLFLIMLRLVVDAIPEITDFGVNYTQADLDAFVIERFLPGQSDEEAATALMLRMEGKLNEKIGLTLSDFVHAHASEKTVSKGMSSVKVGVESVGGAVHSVANSLTQGASSLLKYVWGANH
ncbi:phosphatidylinositol kinase (PIK-D) [Thraustotheca clavata]|uniref:Phosphatidylinositol kinase (PIK-D) n=1 Tax=Thraustotheca clavata TaxID=74557 RepID=A0A1V9Z324_9STRA|nr:phosphatidylinositol kinase (PIK-D) [Thraustotheca clavata]